MQTRARSGQPWPRQPRELKLCLRDSAGALEHDFIFGVAGNFAGEPVQLFRKVPVELMLKVRPWR